MLQNPTTIRDTGLPMEDSESTASGGRRGEGRACLPAVLRKTFP